MAMGMGHSGVRETKGPACIVLIGDAARGVWLPPARARRANTVGNARLASKRRQADGGDNARGSRGGERGLPLRHAVSGVRLLWRLARDRYEPTRTPTMRENSSAARARSAACSSSQALQAWRRRRRAGQGLGARRSAPGAVEQTTGAGLAAIRGRPRVRARESLYHMYASGK